MPKRYLGGKLFHTQQVNVSNVSFGGERERGMFTCFVFTWEKKFLKQSS